MSTTTTTPAPPKQPAETSRSTKRAARSKSWSRRRMQIRSIISSILPIGWTWVAVNALIPYFWGEHGPGTSEQTILWLSRATWTSMHVWTSIGMTILTIVHVVLNRKGVARSYKMLGGTSGGASDRIPSGAAAAKKRSWAWVPALALTALVVAGGFWFAGIDGDSHGGSDGTELSQGRGAGRSGSEQDAADHEESGDAGADHEESEDGGYRGGRGTDG